MADRSKIGKSSRARGHAFEVELGKYLTERGPWGTVVTARSVGANTEEDLVVKTGPTRHEWQRLPVSVEAKYVSQFSPVAWLEQAERQAVVVLQDGERITKPYVVIWKQKGKKTGRSFVIERLPNRRWVMGWLDDWLDQQNRAHRDIPF